MNTYISQTIIKLSQYSLFILALLLTSKSYAEIVNPQVLLEQVTNTTFERIELDQQNIQSDPEHLRLIIQQELMPHIDHQFAAFKVLGGQFRSVPRDKLSEYVDEFRAYLVSSFAVVLANYGGQQIVFEPITDYQNQTVMTIKSIISQAGQPDIRISFKLRKNRNTGQWKTYDLVAEGISLLSSKRSQFSSMIRQQGIQAVIDEMKDKNSKPLNMASNTP